LNFNTKLGAVLNRVELNPYIYSFETLDNIYLYLPYKQTLASFSKEEWDKIKSINVEPDINKALREKKIYVDQSYSENFIEFYKKQIGSPSLRIVYIISTDACNFNCRYCFIENNFNTQNRSTAKVDDVIKWVDYAFANSNDKLHFIFYGGEPLLNKELVLNAINHINEQKQKYHRKPIEISINTNGSIYNDELADEFKKFRVNLSISLDGPKDLNDKGRVTKIGDSAFDLAFKNIWKYIDKGVNVSLSITITKYNINFLPQIARWVVDTFKGKINGVGFNPPMESEFGNPITVEDFKLVMLQIYNAFRIFKKYGIYEDRVMRRLNAIIDERPHLKDCAGAGNQIVISADGKIGPCQAFIGSGRYFKDIVPEEYNFKSDETILEWNSITPVNKEECKKCPFILICGNGCPYYASLKDGTIHGLDRGYCEMLPIMINEILKDNFYGKIKAIFLDYDDTLMLRGDLGEVLNEVAKIFGIVYKIDYKKFMEENGGYLNVRDFFVVNGVSEVEINKVIAAYIKAFKKGSILNTWLIEQLKKINLPTFILTNNSERMVIDELRGNRVEEYFAGVFGNSSYKKPSKEFYENVFKTTGYKPEEIIYIGDSMRDLLPIYNFGCRVALLSPKDKNYTQILENGWLVDLCQ